MEGQVETLDTVCQVLSEALGIDRKDRPMNAATPLFGEMPEFDSMAVMVVMTALEQRFDLSIDDADLTAEVFDTVGSLAEFIHQARQAKLT